MANDDYREPQQAAREHGLKARHETKLARIDIALIRDALKELPEQCWYHGEQLVRAYGKERQQPCCDTGKPALMRRVAEEALERLERAIRRQVAEEIAQALEEFARNDPRGRSDMDIERAAAIAREIGTRETQP